MHASRFAAVALAAGLFFAAPALAQEHAPSPFTLEPYGGVFFDNAFSGDVGLDREGAVGGLRIGWRLGDRTRLVADLGYVEIDGAGHIGVTPDLFVYGVNQVQTTMGVDWTLLPGRTSALLGLQAGVVWRGEEIEGVVGDPLPQWDETGGWTPHLVATPSVALRRDLNRRLGVELRLSDQLMLADADVGHSPSLTLGISLR